MKKTVKLALVGAFAVAALTLVTFPVAADHAWGNFHWARSSNPVTINLGDNVDPGKWGAHLSTAANDWDRSQVLATPVVAGGTSPRNCRPTSGMVEVCSDSYGNNGWLGIAQIWASGDHITQGVAKLNDFYHDQAPYNSSSWKQLVMCQEVGHTFGLGHQNEDFSTDLTNSCMEYTSNPQGNESPDSHDYQVLEDIYAHLDGGGGGGGGCKGRGCKNGAPPAWGIPLDHIDQWGELVSVSKDRGQATFMQDYGNGFRVITHVTWTPEMAERIRGGHDDHDH